jgi:hypothetical protein
MYLRLNVRLAISSSEYSKKYCGIDGMHSTIPKIIHPVVFIQSKDDGSRMIKKHSISESDIKRLAQFVVEDSQSPSDVPELIGMFLENISGLENLSETEIEELIIAI